MNPPTAQSSNPDSGKERRDPTNSLYAVVEKVDVVDFAVARAVELKALRSAAASVHGNRRVYQKLSWHSRRRTMSHSSHRMPVRLKAAHIRQLRQQRAPGEPERKPGPRGSARLRKYRKKARFLSSIRKLRSANPSWLETHIWHAKRFTMDVVGGKKLAIACCDRGYRSCYRAASHSSIAHDSSYLEIIEVKAQTKTTLSALLKTLFSFEDGCRATTDPVMSGCRRVPNLTLIDQDNRAIAPCDLLWRPAKAGQLWLWVLPQVKSFVKELLTTAATNIDDYSINVNCISNAPLCFSIIGPRAGAVLGAVLQPDKPHMASLKLISQSRSPDCLPRSCTFSGSTRDPRVSFPPKTMSEQISSVGAIPNSAEVFRKTGDNELWESSRRDHWKNVILQGASDQKKKFLVPFMLLHRADGMRRGFGSGWDLIIPAGWGMAFWVSIMYANGTRAIGQQDMRLLKLEGGLPIFPEDYLDTMCGEEAMRKEEGLLLDKYRRRPKSKRVNYALYRIKSPMFPALKEVALQELSRFSGTVHVPPPQKRKRTTGSATTALQCGVTKVDDITVRIVRSRQKLQTLLGQYMRFRRHRRQPGVVAVVNTIVNPQDECCSFLRVELIAHGKGVPSKNAIICALTNKDRSSIKGDKEPFEAVKERRGRVLAEDIEPSRDVIGHVTIGGYNLTRGIARGLGVITASAMKRLLEEANGECKGLTSRRGEFGLPGVYVLFRNVNSLYYRLGIARVLV